MKRPPLPIDEALPRVLSALRETGRAVLQAPPGAGKTTAVPLALAEEPWTADGRIVMLEPRRLAARAAARRMATMSGGRVGELVGFRIRGETAVGPATRIEVVTEGVLNRMLASDPTLDGVSCVIFDEFHERSLVADVGLALTLRTAELVRPDLRLLVMSATLDGAAVSSLLGDAPVVTSEGRAFPVETRWIGIPGRTRPLDGLAVAVQRAVAETEGDVLVFVPGAVEIRRLAGSLDGVWPADRVRVFELHGSMPAGEQDLALGPSPAGGRKVVIATSIAETSLTIAGVRAVVDSGYSRVPKFDVRSGMTRLETVRVTRDAADQRRGRAGRTAPGACYRLWSEGEHAALLVARTPEILSADLAPPALDLALAGVDEPSALRWLDAPPAAAFTQARALLVELDALRDDGTPTAHGRRMAALGLHPRIAHMVLRGDELGATALACDIAALLGERDVLRHDAPDADPDLALRLMALRGEAPPTGTTVDRGRVARVRDEARRIRERLGGENRTGRAAPDDPAIAGTLLALAYPDRIALARARSRGAPSPAEPGRFRMRNGRGARVGAHSPLARAEALAIADTDGATDDARIYLAAPIAMQLIEELFGEQVRLDVATSLDERSGAVTRIERRMLGELVLSERAQPTTDPAARREAFIDRVRRSGLSAIPWNDASARTRERLAFVHALNPEWPDVSDEALLETLDEWLEPMLAGVERWNDLGTADLGAALIRRVPRPLQKQLDRLAPTHIAVGTGSRVPVNYSDPRAPTLSVRMQELFGTAETPTIGGGAVALTLHLLSPAGRPIQVTRDLARFWSGSYAEIRKEMRGRYPRHPWPEDPLTAPPTRRAKPRKGPAR